MPQIDLSEPVLIAIRYFQLVVSFVAGIGFLCGLFLFIYSFKNPLRRRAAFVLTMLSPMILLFSIHGAVVIAHYVFTAPAAPNEAGLHMFEAPLEKLGGNLYEAFTKIVRPLLVLVIIIGIGVIHHASRIPGRKRIAYGVFVGVPGLWFLIDIGPNLYRLLLS